MFKRVKGRAVPPPQPTVAQVRAEQDQRMANLAMELGVAGVAVLVEEFGFTPEQARRWLDLMLKRAQANRAAGATQVLDDWKSTTPPTSS